MRHSARLRWLLLFVTFAVVFTAPEYSYAQVTTPMEELGVNIGDDYNLFTYTQFEAYWRKLAEESPRMVLEEIGQTAEGRTQLMAIITSPENHRNLDRYKEINRRLVLAEGLADDEARALADEAKAVVWIDGGLHANEIVGPHQLMEMVYQMVSLNDAETMRFLDDVILLAVHANPDGMELQSSWYMRNEEPTERSTSGLPVLYQKYTGHDNNRDAFMNAMPETINMSRILYREWFPQIMYNHHQTGPAGTVLFAPPFRDPFNYSLDPLVIMGIDAVGTAIHTRLVAEGKPGSTRREGASYSTWWNGCQRCTPYWHNMIGLLSEINGNPTPMEITLLPDRQLASNDLPYPIAPQPWHFRQAIDYSITANRAVMDYASRQRDQLVFNMYQMGRNAIQRGNSDHWTIHPQRIEALREAAAAQPQAQQEMGRRSRGIDPALYEQVLHDPIERDPRGFIIPSDQADFPTATKFVNALIKSGIFVHRATSDFTVAGKRYPSGSYVVKAAQAFRPHLMDMFEAQDHPNDFQYPGGPPIPPYDNAGWTLAFQMGVEFDRILDGFDGPFEKIEDLAVHPAGAVANADGAEGFMLSHGINDAFIAMNRLVAAGENVYWLTENVTVGGHSYPAGTIYIDAKRSTAGRLAPIATELGLKFEGVSESPRSEALKMKEVRVGLWDQYGGSMPSGWTRFILEEFEFPFEVVYPQQLNSDRLSRDYDVLVFVSGGIPSASGQTSRYGFRAPPDPATIPTEYHHMLGSVTADTTIPQIVEFMNDGGTVITIGSSTALAEHAGLPVENHLLGSNGSPLPMIDYFVPTSVLEVRVDNTNPLAYGMGDRVKVAFANSPTFKLGPNAAAQGLNRVAWFDTDTPLLSGWAWGQEYLENGVAMIDANVGDGKLFMFGPEIVRRAEPHGTFKFFFNGIYLSTAEEDRVR